MDETGGVVPFVLSSLDSFEPELTGVSTGVPEVDDSGADEEPGADFGVGIVPISAGVVMGPPEYGSDGERELLGASEQLEPYKGADPFEGDPAEGSVESGSVAPLLAGGVVVADMVGAEAEVELGTNVGEAVAVPSSPTWTT